MIRKLLWKNSWFVAFVFGTLGFWTALGGMRMSVILFPSFRLAYLMPFLLATSLSFIIPIVILKNSKFIRDWLLSLKVGLFEICSFFIFFYLTDYDREGNNFTLLLIGFSIIYFLSSLLFSGVMQIFKKKNKTAEILDADYTSSDDDLLKD